jgi:hypothetical protein
MTGDAEAVQALEAEMDKLPAGPSNPRGGSGA